MQKAAEILGLAPYLDRYPRQLSGGQRQRVAMGRAIVRDPQVFLFDEPLSNLDAKLRVQMRTEIKELHQRLKTTSIYVTHDQIEAMTMADKIVVMHDGVVEQIGDPLELYDRSGEHLRRRLHRLAGDEHDPGHGADRRRRASRRRVRRRRRAAAARGRPRRRRPAGALRHAARALHARAGDGPAGRGRRRRADRRRHAGLSAGSTARRSPRPSASAPIAAPATGSASRRISARAHLFDAATGQRLAA